MNYRSYFVKDPRICDGEPVIAGTHVPVRAILASLAEGTSEQEIVEDLPGISEAAVRAVVAFAATVVLRDIPPEGIPTA